MDEKFNRLFYLLFYAFENAVKQLRIEGEKGDEI